MERMNKSLKKYLVVSIFSLPFAPAVFAEAEDSEKLNYTPDDYRNFYGICWRGSPQDNIDYARQMGYTHVVYQWGMENCKNIDGLKYFLETPESGTANRTVDIRKKYTPEEIREFETTLALKDATKPFPQNIATGWFGPPYRLSGILDFQQKRMIDRIMERIDRMAAKAPGFKFAGIAWDVPQAEGDFWSEREGAPMNNGRQVTIKYWTGSDSASKHPDVVHDYPTYSQGHMEFYRYLFEQVREKINKDAKFIVEPSAPYKQWVQYFECPPYDKMAPEERKKYEADLIAVEGATTGFVTDERLFAKGTVKPSQMCSTTPNAYEEPISRKIAALAAKNGAWTAFFGMADGNGHTPGLKTITQIPARLKLVKAIPVWENLLNIPLEQRKWDGERYESPTAQISPDAYSGLQPKTDKLFFVFLSMDGKVKIPEGYEPGPVYLTNELFKEVRPLYKNPNTAYRKTLQDGRTMKIENSTISPTASYIINTGYIMHLKKKAEK